MYWRATTFPPSCSIPGHPTITTLPRNALHAIVLERCVITPNTARHSIQRPMTPSVRVVGLVAGWSTRRHFPEDPSGRGRGGTWPTQQLWICTPSQNLALPGLFGWRGISGAWMGGCLQ